MLLCIQGPTTVCYTLQLLLPDCTERTWGEYESCAWFEITNIAGSVYFTSSRSV